MQEGEAPKVNGHDFASPDVPRAHPYGVYDLARNRRSVNVGTDHDTETFAVASIREWWLARGRRAYPKAKRLLITADAGGSNGSRLRLWKWELQCLADYATVVNLIARTTTTTGLNVSCRLDRRRYPTGRKISDAAWAKICLHRDDFHGD